METLNEIGLRHGTDKASSTHHYLETYEHYLKDWREREFVLLEIGVADGNSIKMWREYFPNAKVYGIDINKDCAGYVDGVFIGSQTDTAFLDDLFSKIGQPNIIIDDGSHVGSDMEFTFRYLFPKMKPGGYYIVEDAATLYIPTYSGEFESNGRSRGFNFFSGLLYDVDVAGRGCNGYAPFCIDHPTETPAVPEFSRVLESIFFHCSLYWFKRRA